MNMGFGVIVGVLGLLTACGSTPGSEAEEQVSAIDLSLSATAASGTEYRLGPATFDILAPDWMGGEPITTLAADGDARTLHVPLEPGQYRVRLQPAWTLSRVNGQTLTPVAATLTSEPEVKVTVFEYETSHVEYAFHLGESGIDIGLTVDE